jgi:AGZA family xanthine/uracil permease-like MFS transporter
MNYDGVVFATAISAAVGSAMVGLWGNLPFGLAAGMGLNSYFTYAVVIQLKVSFRVALTASFIHGLLFTLLSLAGACNLIQQLAPDSIKKSITVGLGLFQALIGFESMRLIVQGKDTLLALGDVSSVRLWLSMMGLLLIAILLLWKVKAAMLIGMAVITAVVWGTGLEPPPATVLQWPSLGNSWLALDFAGYWAHFSSMFPVTLMFLFVSVFDTAGVQATAARQADLLNAKGHLAEKESTAAFVSASAATCVGALLGSSPVIIHTECCAGIADGQTRSKQRQPLPRGVPAPR